MIEKKEKRDYKKLHIAIIILGIIFISIPIFHGNLWFDESYTVGIASKSFWDIWKISSHDVHPILYYWILHIFYLIFGSNIYIYRFVSMIPIAILSILGYTHIKKDFGEKVGILFSFLILFLPVSVTYSGEIRMYTWAMLFVSLMAIYAYRIYQQGDSKEKIENNVGRIKNWILFTIFSLASCYIHYYGLATAGIVNVMLFIYLVIKILRNREKNEIGKDMKAFTISAIIQILLYIPWIMAAIIEQLKGFSNGFWIPEPSADIFLQIFVFQFTGNLDVAFIHQNIAIIFGILISTYSIYAMIKTIKLNRENGESSIAGIGAIIIYLAVMLCVYIISKKKPLLYARYFLNLTGLFIFFLAFFIAKGGKKFLTIIFSVMIIVVSTIVNYHVAKMNYDNSNTQPLAYVKQDLQVGDMILFGNEGSGFVLSMQLMEVPNCFYDKQRWNVEPAYEAFGKDMLTIKTLEPLDNYQGRIWIINTDSYEIYNEFVDRYGEKIELIKQGRFHTEYHKYQYSVTLIEKEK